MCAASFVETRSDLWRHLATGLRRISVDPQLLDDVPRILALLAEAGIGRRLWSVRAVDSFVPLGTATSAVLIGTDQIVAGALTTVSGRLHA